MASVEEKEKEKRQNKEKESQSGAEQVLEVETDVEASSALVSDEPAEESLKESAAAGQSMLSGSSDNSALMFATGVEAHR